ncbi:MAG: tetratricopeptide repeat-containing sensor histidine kinase [Bacteroidota bacterium]
MKSRLASVSLFILFSLQLFGNHDDSLAVYRLMNTGSRCLTTDRVCAIGYYLEAISLADSLNYMDDSVASVMYMVSNFEYYRGNTERAIETALKALKHYRETGNQAKIVRMLVLVGDILRGNNLYDQSYRYLHEAKAIALRLNDSAILASVFNRLAAIYFEDKRIPPDTAEKYALLSLAIAERAGDKALTYNNQNILGVIEINRGNYRKALEHFHRAFSLVEKTFPEDVPLILINMARAYDSLSNPEESEKLSLKALSLAQEMNIPQYVRLSCMNLEEINLRKWDYKNAHKYACLYYQAKETILTQKVLVQLQEFNNRLASEKQRSENQKLLYEQQLARGRLQTYTGLGILLIILLVVSVGFWTYQSRQRNKINRIAAQLDQSNKVLKRFMSILGHDLRSPFNVILGFTDILKYEDDLSEEERKLYTGKLHDVSRSTFRLLESLLEWSQIQAGSIKPDIRSCDLSELIRETIVVVEPAAQVKRITIRNADSGPVMIDADANMIMTILRNIMSNAIKFTNPDGFVQVKTGLSASAVTIEIADNGVGITPEDLGKLLHLNTHYKSKGTNGEPGSGLGLILCREYAEMHKGSISVASEKDKGSAFTICLPVKSV